MSIPWLDLSFEWGYGLARLYLIRYSVPKDSYELSLTMFLATHVFVKK